MTARVSHPHAKAPAAIQAMMALEQAIGRSGLEPALIELVCMRASQINGCGFCLALHALTARKAGESGCGSTCSMPSANRVSTARANARRWPGPRR